jgi:hypothetical protein
MPFSHAVRLLRIHADADERRTTENETHAVELPKKSDKHHAHRPTDRPIDRTRRRRRRRRRRRGPPNDD